MDKKTGNSSIKCTVSNCAYHAPQNCCSLSQIQVGSCRGTECASFQLGNQGGCR